MTPLPSPRRYVPAGPAAGPSPARFRRGRTALLLATLVLATALESAVAAFIRARGVKVGGDEPHYLIVARALTRLSPDVTAAYQADLRAHTFYPWPAGWTLTTIGHAYHGLHGAVSVHGLGVPLLIAPFLAVGGMHLAFVGFFALESAGLLYLHQRMSWLAGLGWRGRSFFALLLAGPALVVGATQLYPDLPTGIALACAVTELAVIERGAGSPRPAVVGLAAGFLPWMHDKSFLPAALLVAALVAVARRARLPPRSAVTALALVGFGWIMLLSYNRYYFGHLLGVPQPPLQLSRQGLTQTVALVTDRDQGLAVQAPTVLVGLVGLWLSRRWAPVSVAVTLLGAGAVLVVNGTFVASPFGGYCLAGRFEWTLVPLLLAWSPWLITRLGAAGARLGGLSIAVAGLWVLEVWPIIAGHHGWYNIPKRLGLTVRPSTYPGWWPAIDRLLPGLVRGSPVVGTPVAGFLLEIALIVGGGLGLLCLVGPPPASVAP